MPINAIVTMPPYAPYMKEVLGHRIVSGIRLNTVMPIKDSLDDVLKRMMDYAGTYGKELWVDLKCRQLRTATYAVPPFTDIELTHSLTLDEKVNAYFHDGKESAVVLKVNGNKLIVQDGPRRVVGPGESVNIPHPSLAIEGYFTDTDKKYIEASVKIGLHNYMLSFVELPDDVLDLRKFDPDAVAIEKIESVRGLNYVNNLWKGGRLMAARGDLYVELKMPHQIVEAVESILKKDPDAVVASRIFPSLAESLEPECSDIGDVDNLLRMGYKTFMFGDDICLRRDSIMSGLNLFMMMAERYQ